MKTYKIYNVSYSVGDKTILPLCTQGILDKRSYKYSFDSVSVAMEPVQDPPCKLKYYNMYETVKCFDNLLNYGLKESKQKTDRSTGYILLAFVGDSRVRQLYYESFKVKQTVMCYTI